MAWWRIQSEYTPITEDVIARWQSQTIVNFQLICFIWLIKRGTCAVAQAPQLWLISELNCSYKGQHEERCKPLAVTAQHSHWGLIFNNLLWWWCYSSREIADGQSRQHLFTLGLLSTCRLFQKQAVIFPKLGCTFRSWLDYIDDWRCTICAVWFCWDTDLISTFCRWQYVQMCNSPLTPVYENIALLVQKNPALTSLMPAKSRSHFSFHTYF